MAADRVVIFCVGEQRGSPRKEYAALIRRLRRAFRSIQLRDVTDAGAAILAKDADVIILTLGTEHRRRLVRAALIRLRAHTHAPIIIVPNTANASAFGTEMLEGACVAPSLDAVTPDLIATTIAEADTVHAFAYAPPRPANNNQPSHSVAPRRARLIAIPGALMSKAEPADHDAASTPWIEYQGDAVADAVPRTAND